MKEYTLDFKDAIDIILEGGCVKGEQFVDGLFLKLNRYGQLVLVDAGRLFTEEEKVYFDSLNRQKYRKIDIMTMQELSK